MSAGGFGGEAFAFTVEAGESGFRLGLLAVGLRGALHDLHAAATLVFGESFCSEYAACGLMRLCLLGVGGFAGGGGFLGGVFEEAAMLFALAGEGLKLAAGLG